MKHDRVDRVGTIASSLCAAHCAVCALLPAALGALGLGILLGHEAEWVFSLVAIAFAVGALALGWRRHRSTTVALLLVVGIAGLLASRGLEMGSDHHDHHAEHEAEHTVVLAEASHLTGAAIGVLGGLSLCAGHLLNLRASRRR